MPTDRQHNARQLVSIADAAQYTATSTKTIRRWLANGSLTGYRIGPRLIRVDLNELDAGLRPIPSTAEYVAAVVAAAGDPIA